MQALEGAYCETFWDFTERERAVRELAQANYNQIEIITIMRSKLARWANDAGVSIFDMAKTQKWTPGSVELMEAIPGTFS